MVNAQDWISKKDALSLLEIISACSECTTVEAAHQVIHKASSLIPFENAIYGIATLGENGSVQHYDTINFSYPVEWLELYRTKKFIKMDPIVLQNFSTYGLQYWAETYRNFEIDREFVSISRDFCLDDGYAWGTTNRSTTEGCLLSISGPLKKGSSAEFVGPFWFR